MPTLLQINVVSNMLSTGKITNDIARVAKLKGWDTYIAYGRNAKPGVSKEIRIGSMLNTYCHYAANRLFDKEGLVSKIATRVFLKKIDAINPDVIHLHNIHDHYLNYPLLFQYIADHNIPVVWTQHDCWAFTGGCGYFDTFDCLKWKNECKKCPEKRALFDDKSLLSYRLKKKYINLVNNIVFVPVSEWLADCMYESSQKDKEIRIIHNGIDINIFKPIPKKDKSSSFKIIGVAAPWSDRKGLPDFIKLRSLLSDDYQITLVGLSKKQIKELPKGIIGFTRTSNIEELVQLYSDSDVFVNPTYSDNYPTTNLEALACGTPVITYNTGGSPEAVDTKTGLVIPQGDVVRLANDIMWMKVNPFSSSDCRNRAEQYFDKNKCFEKYIELYDELISTVVR